MRTFDGRHYVQVNDRGGLVYQSCWHKTVMIAMGRDYLDRLYSVIEDNIIETADGEKIDWDKVEEAE